MTLSTITLMPLVGTGTPVTLLSYALEGWSFRDLIDWWGLTAEKREPVERPQGHGAFPVAESLRSSRAISFNANFHGGSQADVEVAFDSLSAVGAEGPVLMTVTTPAGSSWRVVTVQGVKPTRHRGGSGIGQVAVDVLARDPRRYESGEWVETGPPSPGQGEVWPETSPTVWPAGGSVGRVALRNTGRAPSAPMFELHGPFESAEVTCVENGRRFRLLRPVPAGSVVEVAASGSGTRRAVLDGQSDVSRWLRLREWVDVPGLSTRTFQFDTEAPTARLRAKVDHAWW